MLAAGLLAENRATAGDTAWVSKFLGAESFQGDHLWSYPKQGTEYGTGRRLSFLSRSEGCDSRLQSLQSFAFSKMKSIGYLTEAQAAAYQKGAENWFHPGQITFFHLTADEDQIPGETDTESKASLWSVSNLTYRLMDATKPGIDAVPLPFELDAVGKNADLKAIREKYPMMWEIGRAAQAEARQLDELLPFAVLNAIQEVAGVVQMTHGMPLLHPENLTGAVEHGAFVFHSLSEAHTRAYERRHPGRRIPGIGSDSDAVFLVPLTEMIEKYSVEKKLAPIRQLIEASHGAFDTVKAVAFLIEVFRRRYQEVDPVLAGNRLGKPLVVSAVSRGSLMLPSGFFEAWGLSAAAVPNVMELVGKHEQLFYLPTQSRLADWVEPVTFENETRAKGAFYVTNLDPVGLDGLTPFEATLMTQNYLFSAVEQLVDMIYQPDPSRDARTAEERLNALVKLNPGIAVGVTHPGLFKTLDNLNPASVIEKPVMPSGFEIALKRPQGCGDKARLYVFSVAQLVPFLKMANLHRARPIRTRVGWWDNFLKRANPYLF